MGITKIMKLVPMREETFVKKKIAFRDDLSRDIERFWTNNESYNNV